MQLMIMPFLTSAQVILTAEHPVDQPGNIAMSSLVLFLCQVAALTNIVIYCLNPFGHTTYKVGTPLTCQCWTAYNLFPVPFIGLQKQVLKFQLSNHLTLVQSQFLTLPTVSGILIGHTSSFFLWPSIQGGILSVLFKFVIFLCFLTVQDLWTLRPELNKIMPKALKALW